VHLLDQIALLKTKNTRYYIYAFSTGGSTADSRAIVQEHRKLGVLGFRFDAITWVSDTIQSDAFAMPSEL